MFLKTSLNTEHSCLPESVNVMVVGVDILDLAACKDGETVDTSDDVERSDRDKTEVDETLAFPSWLDPFV